jgi:hypothetical protein
LTNPGAAAVYSLCLLASAVCAILLLRTWLGTRQPLLLWSSLCFALLAANNLFVVLDMVVFAHIDFTLARQATALSAVSILLFGFVWESDR